MIAALQLLHWLGRGAWRAASSARMVIAELLGDAQDFAREAPPVSLAPGPMLAEVYRGTFCGRCPAGPCSSAERCNDCRALLVDVIRTMHQWRPVPAHAVCERCATILGLKRTPGPCAACNFCDRSVSGLVAVSA